MTAAQQAARYVAKCPPAVSGQNGHGTTLGIVSAVVNGFALSRDEAIEVLTPWNQTCQPPWSEKDFLRKINEAIRLPHDKPRGHKLNARTTAAVDFRGGNGHQTVKTPPPPRQTVKKAVYDLRDSDSLPEPMQDGTRQLLRAAFETGEGIRIVAAKLDDAGHEVPDGKGPTLSREEWLRQLDAKNGDPNRLFKSPDRSGIYIGLNPLKSGTGEDSDVTAFRHALIEFDESISIAEQFNLYQQSNIPCTAIIFSGGKSVHAWVKVDAQTRAEYDERVAVLHEHFSAYPFDGKNKNPARLSRLPNCVRFSARQELWALNTGATSWSEWLAQQQTDGIGTVVTVDQLVKFDAAKDTNSLLGRRWVCRGGSCLIIGPSGVGKSSLMMQKAVCWALGIAFCGIAAVKPMKSLIIQAENDLGDMAEMFQGVVAGMGIKEGSEQYALLKSNLIFVRDTTHTGHEFTMAVQRLIDRHRPDLVWFDPLLSFIGDDISRQEVCGRFLRNWLSPISESTGVAWMLLHHTNKPSQDPKARKGWKSSDYSYMGAGSAELTNWARATCYLQQLGDGEFEFKLTKRGKRAEARDPDGNLTNSLFLRHAKTGIFWEQMADEYKPGTTAPGEEKKKKQTAAEKLIACGLGQFVESIPIEGYGVREFCRALGVFKAGHSTARKIPIASDTPFRNVLEIWLENETLKQDAVGRIFRP